MRVINAIDVNEAYRLGISLMLPYTQEPAKPSRAGDVWECDDPVTTCYEKPWQRVLWDERRDCNPFFHLFESLWMLAGREDVAFLDQFNAGMKQYSDNKVNFHGAYGYRWRFAHGTDQLAVIIDMLRRDPTTRRAVLGMWDPRLDLDHDGVDIPCNLCIKFEARRGALDMMVFNRSNDMIFGAFGANAVHMSILQEYVAAQVGLKIGRYWQVSGNFHVYTKVWHEKVGIDRSTSIATPYTTGEASHSPIVDRGFPTTWDSELYRWMNNDNQPYGHQFFELVAKPMRNAWFMRRDDKQKAHAYLTACFRTVPSDWLLASIQWMERRMK